MTPGRSFSGAAAISRPLLHDGWGYPLGELFANPSRLLRIKIHFSASVANTVTAAPKAGKQRRSQLERGHMYEDPADGRHQARKTSKFSRNAASHVDRPDYSQNSTWHHDALYYSPIVAHMAEMIPRI